MSIGDGLLGKMHPAITAFEKTHRVGRMISGNKADYVDLNPSHLVIFNGNLVTRARGKIWFGDIDVTKSYDALVKLAKDLGEAVFVLREMDCRFETEHSPAFDKAVAVFKPGESK